MAKRAANVHNNYVLIVFDSCRYDAFLRARPRTMRRLGKLERRWSYASWTAPSHYNLLMGLMPHHQPAARIRVGILQERFLASSTSGWARTRSSSNRFVARLYPAGFPARNAGLSHPRAWSRCRC